MGHEIETSAIRLILIHKWTRIHITWTFYRIMSVQLKHSELWYILAHYAGFPWGQVYEPRYIMRI